MARITRLTFLDMAKKSDMANPDKDVLMQTDLGPGEPLPGVGEVVTVRSPPRRRVMEAFYTVESRTFCYGGHPVWELVEIMFHCKEIPGSALK